MILLLMRLLGLATTSVQSMDEYDSQYSHTAVRQLLRERERSRK